MEANKEKELAMVMSAVTILGYCVSALILVLGVPLVLGMVEPNSTYGFRTAQTLADESVWYQLNTIAGWGMIAAGACSGLFIRVCSQYKNLNKVQSITAIGLAPGLFPAVIIGLLYLFLM